MRVKKNKRIYKRRITPSPLAFHFLLLRANAVCTVPRTSPSPLEYLTLWHDNESGSHSTCKVCLIFLILEKSMMVFSQLTKLKTVFKLLWPLLIVNSRILGLIWREIKYFVQKNITYPNWQRSASDECSGEARATHFWRQRQNISNFFTFTMSFGILKSIFVNVQCRLQWEKLPDFNEFPVNINWRQGSTVFPAFWIPIGQVIFQVHQLYAKHLQYYNNSHKLEVHD